MIRRAGLFENGIFVKFGVWRRIVAAVKRSFIRLFRAVVWEGLAGNLPARQAAAIGEGGEKNGINSGLLLQDVEHLFRAFIDKRVGADLETDHFRGSSVGCRGGGLCRRGGFCGRSVWGDSDTGGESGGGFDKVAAGDVGRKGSIHAGSYTRKRAGRRRICEGHGCKAAKGWPLRVRGGKPLERVEVSGWRFSTDRKLGVNESKSRQDIFDDFAADVGQAEISSGIAISKFFVIEAQEMKHGGMKVVDVDWVLNSAIAELVGRAVDVSAFDAAARQPDGEAVVIVIAAFSLA